MMASKLIQELTTIVAEYGDKRVDYCDFVEPAIHDILHVSAITDQHGSCICVMLENGKRFKP